MISPMYSWYPSDVLMISPDVLMISPNVLITHYTERLSSESRLCMSLLETGFDKNNFVRRLELAYLLQNKLLCQKGKKISANQS